MMMYKTLKVLEPGSKLCFKDYPHNVWEVVDIDVNTGCITIKLTNCIQDVVRSYHIDKQFKTLVAYNHRFLVDNTITYLNNIKAKTNKTKPAPAPNNNKTQQSTQLRLPDPAPLFFFGYSDVVKLGLWSLLYNCYIQFVEICDQYNKSKSITKKQRNAKLFTIINDVWKECYQYFYDGEFKLISTNKINKMGYFIYNRGYYHLFNERHDDDLSFMEFLYAFISLVAYHIYHLSNSDSNLFYDNETIISINNKIQSEVDRASSEYTVLPTNTVIHQVPLRIYDNLFSIGCRLYNHQVSPDTTRVLTLYNGTIELPIHQCNTCGNRYVGRETLKAYISVYGELRGIQIINDTYADYSSFSDESLLHLLGYNVQKNNGMTREQRQALLINLMDNGKISYETACETIEGNINRFKSVPRYARAVSEWRADLKFMGDDVIKKKYYYN